MSLTDLLSLSGVPGLSAAVTLLTATYRGVGNIKLYKQQCINMSSRCVQLMLALKESTNGSKRVQEMADEIEAIVIHVHRKVEDWGTWNHLKSFLQQNEIKDGIDRLQRDIDAAIMRFNIQMNMEITRGQLESQAIQQRDKAEIRELLRILIENTRSMRTLLNLKSSEDSHPVEAFMQGLQTELLDPSLRPKDGKLFRDGLWMLREKTSALPPLIDLTGQIVFEPQNTVVKGEVNDVYQGQWLDKEMVALRLPKLIMRSDNEAQQRFKREVGIWRRLEHPNIVSLYGVVYREGYIYSVSPWKSNGTVNEYINGHDFHVDRVQVLCDAAAGLEYLHNRGIIHGDLRGANLLISEDGTACLSNFGLSKLLESTENEQSRTSSHHRNPRWVAPELIQRNGVLSTHSDVWSFAMLCLEVLSGDVPYGNIKFDSDVIQALYSGKLPDRPKRTKKFPGISESIWTLLRQCWKLNPDERPPIANAKASLLDVAASIAKGLPRETRTRWLNFSNHDNRHHTTVSGIPATDTPIESEENLRSRYISLHSNTLTDQLSDMTMRSERIGTNNMPPHLHISTNTGLHSGYLSNNDRRPWEIDFVAEEVSPRLLSISNSTERTSLTTSEAYLSDKITSAVPNSLSTVNVAHGIVLSGTLDGLVGRLLTGFNLSKDIEYRKVFLTTCTDFATPQDVFAILCQKFHNAESNKQREDSVALQYNVFMVMMQWLSTQRLQIDEELLREMKSFCRSAIGMKSSTTMIKRAEDLLRLVEQRERTSDRASSISLLSPGRKLLNASQINPYDLAIALTLLEGDAYKTLTPSDYVAHTCRHPGYNGIENVYTTNNKIIHWVKESILHYDTAEGRADVLKFFIHTAAECRKLRNFSSMVAIAVAAHSTPIELLRLTRSKLPLQIQNKLATLGEIIDPSLNHRSYRAAINEGNSTEEKTRAIPWMALHLRDLHHTLQRHPVRIEVDGQSLINFQRYLVFMDRIKEVFHYQPPDLEQYRQQGQLSYLENQLRQLRLSNTSEDDLMARSKELEAREFLDYRNRLDQCKDLGFRVP